MLETRAAPFFGPPTAKPFLPGCEKGRAKEARVKPGGQQAAEEAQKRRGGRRNGLDPDAGGIQRYAQPCRQRRKTPGSENAAQGQGSRPQGRGAAPIIRHLPPPKGKGAKKGANVCERKKPHAECYGAEDPEQLYFQTLGLYGSFLANPLICRRLVKERITHLYFKPFPKGKVKFFRLFEWPGTGGLRWETAKISPPIGGPRPGTTGPQCGGTGVPRTLFTTLAAWMRGEGIQRPWTRRAARLSSSRAANSAGLKRDSCRKDGAFFLCIAIEGEAGCAAGESPPRAGRAGSKPGPIPLPGRIAAKRRGEKTRALLHEERV